LIYLFREAPLSCQSDGGALKWSAIGGGGVSSSDCYIGMPDDLKTYACWVGRPVLASQSNKTIVGVYVGFAVFLYSGHHYIAASTDAGGYQDWGCYSIQTRATDTGIGLWNTNKIIAAGCGMTAAQRCRNLGDDWFLPSINELQFLYPKRAAIGGFGSIDYYWSSTELDGNYAWYLRSSDGARAYAHKGMIHDAGIFFRIRCVRTF
jgi:hypothetical protein